jgi:GAF domain-containing protein
MSEPPEQSPPFGESAEDEAPELRVPLLRLRGDTWDPLALETWQEALSGLLAPDLPHDLMALWLYPPGQGAVLIGPAALAEDNLQVPVPAPHLGQDQLYTLEQRIRAAGYPSVVCMAIPHGDRDVGLMLLADLRSGVYQLPHAVLLRSVADSLGPPLARIARQWGRVTETEDEDVPQRRKNEPGRKLADLNALLATLGLAESTTRTPRDFAELVSRALQPLLPHDRLQILVPDASGQEHYRFDRHGHGTFWSDPAHVVSHHRFDPAMVFGDAEELLIEDTDTFGETVWCPGPPGVGGPAGQGSEVDPIRSVLAVRLVSQGRVAGYLFLGGLGPGLFRREDLELLHQVIPLVATRVDSFLLAWQLQVMRSHLSVLRNVPAQLGRISELLATTAHLGAATRLFAREAATVLPFDRIEFSLRFGDEEHVVVMGPGETKPLADLPLMRIAGTELGRVLSGEIPHAFATARRPLDPAAQDPAQPTAVLLVPLRVAGRVFGGLTLLAAGLESFTRADIALAQQLADVIAPHLELLRRASMAPSPVAPAWRRRG